MRCMYVPLASLDLPPTSYKRNDDFMMGFFFFLSQDFSPSKHCTVSIAF